ncbi:MAG: ferrous iron transport protein A [Candidatus Hermodarchaeota archaeon]
MSPKIKNLSYKDNKKQLLILRLIECPIGKELKILRVNAGAHAKGRLACLGVIPGVKITIKKIAPFRGPVEIMIKGTSLVIGRGLASKIIVINETLGLNHEN